MSTMDEGRAKSLEAGANMKTGGVNFNYVDTIKLERLGIGLFVTGKKPGGNNFMRIVAASKKGIFALEIWKHSNIGTNNATHLCLQEMFGKPCPICEYAEELKREGADPKIIKELDLDHRFLLFVVDTTSRETEEEGPKWFDCPVTIYKEICVRSKDKRTGEQIDPADPEDGRDIEFTRVDGKRTTYTGLKLVKMDTPIPKSWYEDLPTLEEVLLIPDYDEMQVAVSGKKSSPPKEDDVREESSSRGRGESRGEARTTRGESRGDSRRSSQDDEGARAESVRNKLDELRERKAEERNND